jgi:Cu(I)/Ag(I) efflux system membrane fusion protein
MQKIKKFSFLFLALVVVMGCNTKTRKIIAHQEGESIFHLFHGSPNKEESLVNVPFVIWT